MWKFLKRTISEQESHQIWSFLKRKKSEHISHQMWEFLKRKITEKKSHQIWWFLKRTNLKRFHHIKCESSWIGTCLKKNHIIYHSSWQRKEILETCHVDMSICRYVDVLRCGDSHCSESQAPGRHSFHHDLLTVLRYGKERDLNSRVHHSSS
jgi:hypothetical protein